MKKRRVVSVLMATTMVMSLAAGCGSKSAGSAGGSEAQEGVKTFTGFFAVPGSEINDDNEIQQIIADKTGVKVKETWLTGQTAEEAVVANIRILLMVEMLQYSFMRLVLLSQWMNT